MKQEQKYKKAGFTLIEAIIGLLILVMVINISQIMIQSTKQKVNSLSEDKMELIIQDLENTKHNFKLVEVRDDELTLYNQNEKKQYIFSMYKDHKMARYTPGHVPVVQGIDSLNFEKVNKLVKITIQARGKKLSDYAFIPEKKG